MARPRTAFLRRHGAVALVCCLVGMVGMGVVGCRTPGRPKVLYITGVVRFLNGSAANRATVRIVGTRAVTYSDSVGNYAIAAPRDSESVTLWAVAPRFFDTCTGTVRVNVGPHGAVSDIMLTRCNPF